jgi:hypothetical protein
VVWEKPPFNTPDFRGGGVGLRPNHFVMSINAGKTGRHRTWEYGKLQSFHLGSSGRFEKIAKLEGIQLNEAIQFFHTRAGN